MAEKNEHDYTPDEHARVTADARADMPPSKPCIELDEASGRDMTAHAQKAVHAFGRLLITMGKVIIDGGRHPDQVKIGFDYGVSLAYVEIDVAGIAATSRDQLEQAGLESALDSITVDEGRYVLPANTDDPAAPMPRATYQSSPTSTVRLYLHSTGN